MLQAGALGAADGLNTTSIPTFIRHAAVAALEQGDDFIRTMVGRCVESRAILVDGLARIRGVTVFPPEGAFYLMVRVETGETSLDLAFRLLREAKVGVAPGTAFGPQGEGFLRICFAISPDLAREAVARLTRVLGRQDQRVPWPVVAPAPAPASAPSAPPLGVAPWPLLGSWAPPAD